MDRDLVSRCLAATLAFSARVWTVLSFSGSDSGREVDSEGPQLVRRTRAGPLSPSSPLDRPFSGETCETGSQAVAQNEHRPHRHGVTRRTSHPATPHQAPWRGRQGLRQSVRRSSQRWRWLVQTAGADRTVLRASQHSGSGMRFATSSSRLHLAGLADP